MKNLKISDFPYSKKWQKGKVVKSVIPNMMAIFTDSVNAHVIVRLPEIRPIHEYFFEVKISKLI